MDNIEDLKTTNAASEDEFDDLLYLEADGIDRDDDEPMTEAEATDFLNAILRGEDPEPVCHLSCGEMRSKDGVQSFRRNLEQADAERLCNGGPTSGRQTQQPGSGPGFDEAEAYEREIRGTMFETLPEMEIILENLYVM